VALIASGDTVYTAAVTKLGLDSLEVLRELRWKISRHKHKGRGRAQSPWRRKSLRRRPRWSGSGGITWVKAETLKTEMLKLKRGEDVGH